MMTEESVMLFVKLTHGDRCQVRYEGKERTAVFHAWWCGKPQWRLVRRNGSGLSATLHVFGRRDIVEFTKHRLRDDRLDVWSPAYAMRAAERASGRAALGVAA